MLCGGVYHLGDIAVGKECRAAVQWSFLPLRHRGETGAQPRRAAVEISRLISINKHLGATSYHWGTKSRKPLQYQIRLKTSTSRGGASCEASRSTSTRIQTLIFKEYQASASEDAKRDMANTLMGIYTLQRDVDGQPEDVGIVIEGNIVMDNLGSVIVGFVMLLGLIYALDLSFPDNFKHTFEFMQKVVMNLDGHKLNGKIESLKIKLLD
ncbi:hypothetical protein JOQ06_017356 [Pogonophryne albipinna]|uniref:Uncharacterized protein n=1 Tax=Pogonophryne albipinna TaxID=1090488 RepID=A0AAD6B239_9TELE|nr:hypothetical protein JOQ06_017356 [Pogonophryne albipinna]